MTLPRRLRVLAHDVLSGAAGRRLQDWAWRLVSLHPTLRAVRQARAGAIAGPLAALRRGDFGLPEAAHLRDRLADMDDFCRRHEGGPATPPPRPPSMARDGGRVLFALHSCGAFDATGYAARSVALIAALQRAGVQPAIAVRPGYPWDLPPHRRQPRIRALEYRGLHFDFEPDPPAGLRDPESAYIGHHAERLCALARAHGAGIVHAASNYLNGAAAALAGRQAGLASVYELRGLWHLTRAFHEPGYADSEHFRYSELREIAACREVDHVITLSPGLKHWLVERGIDGGRISVVGNAAPAAAVDAQALAAQGRAVRARLGIAAGERVVGYLGSLVAYEGLDLLIDALARTPPAHRPRLLIVGSGAHEAALRRQAARSRLGERVRFAGRVEPAAAAAHFAAMDAVVLPRRDDTLTRLVPAIKPFEVLALGRPLFVSPPLAQALGDTLAAGYAVLDLAALDRLDRLFDMRPAAGAPAAVPTWDARAAEVRAVYARLAG